MQTIAIVDPLTGQKLHDIEAHSATDVAMKFQAGREAQKAWNKLGPAGRSKIAHKLVDVLIANQEQLMDVLQKETGKSRMHAFEEVTGALAAISYYAKVTPKLLQEKESKGRGTTSHNRIYRTCSSWCRWNHHTLELPTCSNHDGCHSSAAGWKLSGAKG